MNKQTSPIVPDENRIEELLTKLQPVPSERFHQRMIRPIWLAVDGQRVAPASLRTKFVLAIVAIILLATVFATPQGRAWAQEVIRFFTRVNSTTLPISEAYRQWMNVQPETYELPLVKVLTPALSPEMAALSECQGSHGAQAYTCQVAYAEAQLGFDLKELPALPDDWEVDFLYTDPMRKIASIDFKMDFGYHSYSNLMLVQSLGYQLNTYFNLPDTAVPVEKIQTVKVGPYSGEYVKGGFVQSDDGTQLLWSDSQGFQRLAWSDGTRWYLIEFSPNANLTDVFQRDQLIEFAASLVDHPVKKAEVLNPEALSSIADAEKLSGLDLKAPTLLPLGVDFSSARYFPDNHEVHLLYGMNDELVIYEWKGKTIDFDVLSNTSNKDYEVVKVNGKNAFYGFSSGPMPYWLLWWRMDDLNYQLYYYQDYASAGGILTKEKMIAIAESMGDINDFRGNTFKSYEYISVYEQALGFDMKEFPRTPTGWSYTDVSAYSHPDCISIAYTAQNENGDLILKQCSGNIDPYLDQYKIPRKAITRVKIGTLKGQYILGAADVDSNGNIFWNPNLPYRRLLWQQGGFWMHISIGGDSIALYDQDDLIAYAESLR